MEKDKPLTLEELAEFFSSEIKPEFEKIDDRLNKLEAGQSRLENNVARLEVGQGHIREEIKELKADLSDTPSRREFEELKHRVDGLERTN
jgi:predicted  nucleic acid-binding Zn-ribbon protein